MNCRALKGRPFSAAIHPRISIKENGKRAYACIFIHDKEFISDVDWNRFLDFSHELETPCVVVNPKTIKNNFLTLRELFPYSQIYYAVKANPERAIVSMLAELGCNFDIASRPELDMLLALAIDRRASLTGIRSRSSRTLRIFTRKACACS